MHKHCFTFTTILFSVVMGVALGTFANCVVSQDAQGADRARAAFYVATFVILVFDAWFVLAQYYDCGKARPNRQYGPKNIALDLAFLTIFAILIRHLAELRHPLWTFWLSAALLFATYEAYHLVLGQAHLLRDTFLRLAAVALCVAGWAFYSKWNSNQPLLWSHAIFSLAMALYVFAARHLLKTKTMHVKFTWATTPRANPNGPLTFKD